MGSDPKNPRVGDLHIDASGLAGFIVDLAQGERQGMRVAQPGLSDVLQEIASNQASIGSQIGVSDAMVARLDDIEQKVSQIDTFLLASRKLVELLEETRAKLDDDRYQVISIIATLVDKLKTWGTVDLYAVYQLTRAYRSAVGVKAAKTREKNAQAASEAGASG